MSDDPYTLSPESIFVKPPPRTRSTRIVESLLGVLQVVVMLSIAGTLVGAVVLGYRAYSSMNEVAQPYMQAARPAVGDRFLAQAQRDLASAGTTGNAGSAGNAATGTATRGNEALDVQLDRQLALVNEFLQTMSRSVTNAAAFRDRQRATAEDLGGADGAAEIAAHARRQADFLQRVLRDKAAMDLVRQRIDKDPAYLDDFMNRLLDFYPSEARHDRQAEASFHRDEGLRVAQAQSNAMSQFAMALGLLGAFIVVTLVLVLLKIERNLRSRGDVIQVMSGM